MNIGSAKPGPEERRRVPHHMIDIREPDELFTAGDYQREARSVLKDVRDRGRIPVLVGGTGLYLRALIEGLFAGPTRSEQLRMRLENLAATRGREYLHRMLKKLDRASAQRIMERDTRKVIRALEVRLETGKPLTEHLRVEPRQPLEGFDVHLVGLNPPRAELVQRIHQRVVRMFEQGFVDEVRCLASRGISAAAKPMGAIGYRHILDSLDEIHEDTIGIIQRDTRRYAKRQMTWFRKLSGTVWFDGFGDDSEIQTRVHRHLRVLLAPGNQR